MPLPDRELLEAAVHSGLVSEQLILQLRARPCSRGQGLLEQVLIRCRLPRMALYRAVADRRGLPYVDWDQAVPETELIRRLPSALMQRRRVLPVRQAGQCYLATSDPSDRLAQDSVARAVGRRLPLLLADPDSLRMELEAQFEGGVDRSDGWRPPFADREADLNRTNFGSGSERAHRRAPPAADDAIGLLDTILREACVRRATDVHLEPGGEGFRVRLRVDGRLVVYLRRIRRAAGAAVLARIKVLARMDVTQQHQPHDGRFSHSIADMRREIRVAMAPTPQGERATLRLLGGPSEPLSLPELGLEGPPLMQVRDLLAAQQGMMLIAGPTGSGKTTTLHAMLRELNSPDRNILTLEDPVEALVEGISQVTAGGLGGLGFASGLRSLLRHDPDVLMVGEIRDAETLDVAVKASLTGHLLLATVHATSAWGAVRRLVDMGCEPKLLGSVLRVVLAQRLVRRLCVHCRQPRLASDQESERLHLARGIEVFGPRGCVHCLGSGYHGRVGLFAPLWVDPAVAAGIAGSPLDRSPPGRESDLLADGRTKVLQGVTSPEEVLHACPDSE